MSALIAGIISAIIGATAVVSVPFLKDFLSKRERRRDVYVSMSGLRSDFVNTHVDSFYNLLRCYQEELAKHILNKQPSEKFKALKCIPDQTQKNVLISLKGKLSELTAEVESLYVVGPSLKNALQKLSDMDLNKTIKVRRYEGQTTQDSIDWFFENLKSVRDFEAKIDHAFAVVLLEMKKQL